MRVDQGHDSGEGGGAGRRRSEVHAPRPGALRGRAHHKAYALRAAWMEIGAAPYLASLRMDQATSWDEFRAACTYSRMPAENMVWADRKGNIGYQAVAIAPLPAELVRAAARCRATAATSGTAICRSTRCRTSQNPVERLYRDGEQLSVPARLSVPRGAALHRRRSFPRVAHQRSARRPDGCTASPT